MSASHGASIRHFHLRRTPAENEPMWIENAMEWIGAEHRDRALWDDYQINWGQRRISEYTVSVPNNAYLVSSVNTRSLPKPRMKHRDIIVDNWKAAGGDLAALRTITVTFITNNDAYDCIQEAFGLSQWFRIIGANIERNSPGWHELITGNPFLEGQQKMLREYRNEFNRARIGRVTIAAHEKSDMVDMYVLNSVTHLTRPSSHRQENPEPEPEQPQPGYSADYFQQQFPQEIQFSDWNNGRY
ncbi:hypothetical protein F4781DRAFT_429708 [Annulohypoxylon bovei var. microspora]|nr:hypothetical protein F4781DRAFT_429708 [Annulohypoxylon bovei var. microspora]